MTALLAQYLGADTIVNRPDPPDIALGFTAFFYAIDEGSLYVWQPAVDPDPGLWKAASPTLPAPADPGLYGWDADSQAWLVIPAGGVPEAPEDGIEYVRKDGDWVESSGGGDASYPDFVGNAGKFLAVTEDESDVEWAVPAGGGSSGPVTDSITATLINGFAAFGSGYGGVEVVKIGRVVTINGLLAGPDNTVMFVLPPGWRPEANQQVSVPVSGGSSSVDIFTNGEVKAGDVNAYIGVCFSFIVSEDDAFDSGGGGGSGLSSIVEQAYQYIADHGPALNPSESFDFVIESGNFVAMYHTRYANTTTYYGAASSYSIPTGKIAYIMAAYPTENTRSDPTYNKNRLYNETTSVVLLSASDFIISRSGFVNADTNTTASATYNPQVEAGVAGDVLRIYAGGGPDSISRSTTCLYILTLGDA